MVATQIFWFSPHIWGRFPIWGAYFSDGLKPSTRYYGIFKLPETNRDSSHLKIWYLEYPTLSFWGFSLVSGRTVFTWVGSTSPPGRVYCEMEGQVFVPFERGKWSKIGSDSGVLPIYILYIYYIYICTYLYTHVSFINAACELYLWHLHMRWW